MNGQCSLTYPENMMVQGSLNVNNSNGKIDFPSHFTKIENIDSGTTECIPKNQSEPHGVIKKKVTPEKPTLQGHIPGHNADEKYDFNSVPLFNRDLFRSSFEGPITSTVPSDSDKKEEVFGNSVVWVPQNREEWDKCSAELTGLCASAGQRRARALRRNYSSILPEIYVKDRIDIDDPLRGFQIRHKGGGWLQGFILTTTFTTWTHYFRWDSRHPKSGMTSTQSPSQKLKWDDGSLSTELESQPRSGDPVGGGVVWSTIAEISLLGGLGCGQYLLRMAMEDISRQGYKFVVLQATPFSKPFYEKFGFKRVGCVTRYGKHPHLVGYRHWTYADEKNLGVHGGPSYMMGVRVKDFMSRYQNLPSILDFVSKFTLDKKPSIMPLPIAPSPKPVTTKNVKAKKRKIDSGKSNSLVRVVSYSNESEKDQMMGDSNKTNEVKKNHVLTEWDLSKSNMKGAKSYKRKRTQDNGKKVLASDHHSKSPSPVYHDPSFLRKQKFTISQRVRSKPIFYNKVVAKKDTERTANSFFFVINFDAEGGTLRLVKLEPRGTFFKGKREGRVKWKAVLNGKKGLTSPNAKYDWTVPASDWDIVPSVMVTKTTIVADESWDIVEPTPIVQ